MIIMIVVVMAMLTGYALHFVSMTASSQAIGLMNLRAEQAANAGLEWARYKIHTNPALAANCVAPTNMLVPFTTGSFAVQVNCVATGTHTDGGTFYTFTLTSTACAPAAAGVCPNPVPPPDYVEHQVSAVMSCGLPTTTNC